IAYLLLITADKLNLKTKLKKCHASLKSYLFFSASCLFSSNPALARLLESWIFQAISLPCAIALFRTDSAPCT
ncbi:hypothetical protein D4R78_08610, partial [bacterium]